MFKYFLILCILFVLANFTHAYGAVQTFSTDKDIYFDGDTLKIFGTVDYDSEIPSVIIQIITPSGTDFASVGDVSPNSDGEFTASFHVGGPTWSNVGTYTIKISYGGIFEKKIEYQNPNIVSDRPVSPPSLISNLSITDSDIIYTENPKMKLLGFPSLDHSPRHYLDRYNNERNYRLWFDSQFPNYSLLDVVGYKSTHIPDFPSLDHSPQYYIDRYNNEHSYRLWFDSQFPKQTIYDVLGFSTFIPDWIKTNALLWHSEKISDSDFSETLNFMLRHKMILLSYSNDDSVITVPNWVKNNAGWWADDLIFQHEFVNSLKYLIEKKIIPLH